MGKSGDLEEFVGFSGLKSYLRGRLGRRVWRKSDGYNNFTIFSYVLDRLPQYREACMRQSILWRCDFADYIIIHYVCNHSSSEFVKPPTVLFKNWLWWACYYPRWKLIHILLSFKWRDWCKWFTLTTVQRCLDIFDHRRIKKMKRKFVKHLRTMALPFFDELRLGGGRYSKDVDYEEFDDEEMKRVRQGLYI